MENNKTLHPKNIYKIIQTEEDVDIIMESGEVIVLHDSFFDNDSNTITLSDNTKISLKDGN